MFTCAKIKNGNTYLSSHLTANDYYCENETVVGHWAGIAAGLMGIEGNAIGNNDADFESLRQNLFPGTSERLTPVRRKEGVKFFDFQCSAQKSVSIMAVAMNDQRLYKAHDKAAARAFAELERFAAFRSGATREPAISGNLCAAVFRHDASRALDPQIHTHFVVANATWDSNSGRWIALDTCEMFRAIRYAGKVYQNELARECRRIGYKIEAIRNDKGSVEGFEIAGVSKDIRERFSKRRAEVVAGIERFRQQKGRMPTDFEKQIITRNTRNVKLHEITTPEVRASQCEQLSGDEIAALEAIKRQAECPKSITMGSAWKALTQAVEHIYERKSVVKGHEVIAEALNRNLGFISLETLRRYMTSAYNGMIQLTQSVKNPLLSAQWTSARGLRHEQWAIEFVNQSQNCCTPLGKTENVAFDFKSDEQRQVVLETLNNRDRVYAIRGCAGAGKTTCLSEVNKGLEAAGKTAIYLAPTSSAVDVLRKDGFIYADTVDSFLTNNKKDLSNAVVIIDESSLQSNKMGAAVLEKTRNARVLFVGDTRQHVSVEAGDFLRVLEQRSHLNSSELKDIRRQEQKEYNTAVRAMSKGDAAGGMKRLDGLGWIHEGRKEYIERAADAYIAYTENGTDLDRCIAISPTWNELYRFTDAIRQRMKERRLLEKGIALTVCHQLDWTLEQRKTADNYRPGMLITFNAGMSSILKNKTFEVAKIESGKLWFKGYAKPISAEQYARKFSVSLPREIELSEGDRIIIRRNHREAKLINGKVLIVDKINKDGSIETRNKDGKQFHIPADYKHFAHGYVVTSYKSQGRTHNYNVVAAEKLDAKTAYVALSRGKKEARVFTPDKQNLFDNLGKPVDRTAATDVIGNIRSAFWRKNEQQAYRHIKNHFAFQNFNKTNNHSTNHTNAFSI